MLKFKKMGTDKVPLLLITANVGSLFEDPVNMLSIWTSEFLQAIVKMDPKFIALHMQEVGGKTYEKSMQYVQDFVQRLCDCPELRLFDKVRIYLDEDFSSPDKFTALGNMYFAHSSLTDLKIWDFSQNAYTDVEGKEVNCGNIEQVTTKEKKKFPQLFFPECKWSRKGFLRTRWMIRGTAIEFVNIHLFHDASNILAMEPFPSVYCRSRRRALLHTLHHLQLDEHSAPYFIFGDFNFRTDAGGVVKKITKDLNMSRIQNSANSESCKYQYRSKDDRLVLTVGKKEFTHVDHQKIFREPWVQRFDREMDALKQHLYEYPVKFPPTYPFEEDLQLPTHYMKTRCPSWCDRVLLSHNARILVSNQEANRIDSRHLHSSRKSMTDSQDSRASSSDSSARSASPVPRPKQGSPSKQLEKKSSVLDIDALSVPGINISRKSIADPTSIQQVVARSSDSEGSPIRRKLVRNQSEGSPKECGLSSELRRLVDLPRKRVDYGMIGETACMGDHKPIYLRVMLPCDRGTLKNFPSTINLPVLPSTLSLIPRLPTEPDLYSNKKLKTQLSYSHPDKLTDLDTTELLKRTRTGSLNENIMRIPHVEITTADYASYDAIFVNDIDSTLLCANRCSDPYTPESIDSRTPNADGNSNSDFSTETVDVLGETLESKPVVKLTRDRSVSPTQLKNRLDKLLIDDKAPLERLNSNISGKSIASKTSSLCCLALKCYGFCRKRAGSCHSCRRGLTDCCTT